MPARTSGGRQKGGRAARVSAARVLMCSEGMLRLLAATSAVAILSSCSAPPAPCSYALWTGSWSGTASYTATTPSHPNGVSGASEVTAAAGEAGCPGPDTFLTLGGCRIDGHLTGSRAMVIAPAAGACELDLTKEHLTLRVLEGTAQIAANDTIELTVGGELVSRQGETFTGARITLDFEGRRQ